MIRYAIDRNAVHSNRLVSDSASVSRLLKALCIFTVTVMLLLLDIYPSYTSDSLSAATQPVLLVRAEYIPGDAHFDDLLSSLYGNSEGGDGASGGSRGESAPKQHRQRTKEGKTRHRSRDHTRPEECEAPPTDFKPAPAPRMHRLFETYFIETRIASQEVAPLLHAAVSNITGTVGHRSASADDLRAQQQQQQQLASTSTEMPSPPALHDALAAALHRLAPQLHPVRSRLLVHGEGAWMAPRSSHGSYGGATSNTPPDVNNNQDNNTSRYSDSACACSGIVVLDIGQSHINSNFIYFNDPRPATHAIEMPPHFGMGSSSAWEMLPGSLAIFPSSLLRYAPANKDTETARILVEFDLEGVSTDGLCAPKLLLPSSSLADGGSDRGDYRGVAASANSVESATCDSQNGGDDGTCSGSSSSSGDDASSALNWWSEIYGVHARTLFGTPVAEFTLDIDPAAVAKAVRAVRAAGTLSEVYKSNKGGWQSESHLFECVEQGGVIEDGVFAEHHHGGDRSRDNAKAAATSAASDTLMALRGQVYAALAKYVLASGPGRQHGFYIDIHASWANINERGAFNAPHTHPDANVVAVFYADTGQELDGAEEEEEDEEHGCGGVHCNSSMGLDCSSNYPHAHLVLGDPRGASGHGGGSSGGGGGAGTRGQHTMSVCRGTLLVFPGWMTHWVTPHDGSRERITVALNSRIYASDPDTDDDLPISFLQIPSRHVRPCGGHK